MNRFVSWTALGLVAAFVAQAGPSLAAGGGDPARGEALFYEHAFSASPASVPLKLFEALPDLYPETFAPEAMTRKFGLLYKEGRSLPIGFVTAPAMGMDRLTFNCSLCHTGTLAGEFVPGLPPRDLDLQSFEETMLGTLSRPDFTADALLPAVKARHPELSWAEEANLRLWVALAKWQAPSRKPSPHRAGPGRFDLMGSFKQRLKLPMHDFNAQMDIAPLFGQDTIKRYPRDGALGGDPDLVRYLIVRLSGDNSPMQEGRIPPWVKDLNAYLFNLQPPRYPHPIDVAKAREARQVFKNTCSGCHGTYDLLDNEHPNRIVPLSVVGTDPNRVRVWDQAAIDYVKHDPIMSRLELSPGVGMMPPSLRGVWATSPYLHNGSVPTLYDVLSAPESRPARFWRGGEPFDPVKVGLSSVAAPASPKQFLYDTTIPGNGNQGHPFGVPLSEAERMAVIEYLKTL